MPDLAAPYFSANDLNAQPGDPSLSGRIDLDTRNPNPFKGIGDTINTLEEQEDKRISQKREQVNRMKQQEQAFKNDLLAKAMDYDQQDKVMQYHQGIKDRDEIYKIFSSEGSSAFNMKGDNGENLSFSPLKGDDKILNDYAYETLKGVTGNYTKYNSNPEFRQKEEQFKRLKGLAGTRSVMVAKMKQALASTNNPEEQKKIKKSIEDIENTPLSEGKMPEPYVPSPDVKSIIGDKGKDAPTQKFEVDGKSYKGLPQVYFDEIAHGPQSEQVWKNARVAQNLPEVNDPLLFQDWESKMQQAWKARGGDGSLELGYIDKNGKIVLNPDPRPFAAAMELIHKGGLIPDEDAEMEDAKLDHIRAQTNKLNREPSATGKKTKEELVEDQAKTGVRSVVKDVRGIFDASKHVGARPVPQFPNYWKKQGVDPAEYTIHYQLPQGDGKRYIGLEADPTTEEEKDASGKTITKTVAGESKHPDKVFLVENKKTGNKELIFFKDEKLIAKVGEKQAVVNAIKADSKYDPKLYQDQTPWVEEVFGEEAPSQAASAGKAASARPKNVAPDAVWNEGKKFWVDRKNKKIYTADGVEVEVTR